MTRHCPDCGMPEGLVHGADCRENAGLSDMAKKRVNADRRAQEERFRFESVRRLQRTLPE